MLPHRTHRGSALYRYGLDHFMTSLAPKKTRIMSSMVAAMIPSVPKVARVLRRQKAPSRPGRSAGPGPRRAAARDGGPKAIASPPVSAALHHVAALAAAVAASRRSSGSGTSARRFLREPGSPAASTFPPCADEAGPRHRRPAAADGRRAGIAARHRRHRRQGVRTALRNWIRIAIAAATADSAILRGEVRRAAAGSGAHQGGLGN